MLAEAFVLFGAPVTWLEILAFLLALACVALSVYEIHWSWPLAFASSLLYAWLFGASKLYGEAALQGFFAATALWGWWQWLFGRRTGEAPTEHLRVARLTGRGRWRALGAWLLAWLAVAAVLLRYSDSDVPFADGFASEALWLTALLYVVFAALALAGWRRWQRQVPQAPSVAPVRA